MAVHVQQDHVPGLEVEIGRDFSLVRIPRTESETDCLLLEEQLLSQVCRRPATHWTIDLSEHTNGITLVLAGILAGLSEEARRAGSTIRCVGLHKTGEQQGNLYGEASAPAGCSGKGWMRGAEAPSYLYW